VLLAALQDLYGYHDEATVRVLETAEALAPAEFVAVVTPGQPAVRDTLVHLCTAQRAHLEWWRGAMTGEAAFARRVDAEDFSGR
jgi:uncharacterized damage-inducible protein DinB